MILSPRQVTPYHSHGGRSESQPSDFSQLGPSVCSYNAVSAENSLSERSGFDKNTADSSLVGVKVGLGVLVSLDGGSVAEAISVSSVSADVGVSKGVLVLVTSA